MRALLSRSMVLLVLGGAVASAAPAKLTVGASWRATVVEAPRGDQLVVVPVGGRAAAIRLELHRVAAPRYEQRFAAAARSRLDGWTYGQSVTVTLRRARAGHAPLRADVVGADGRDIAQRLVRAGLAWTIAPKKDRNLATLQAAAKSARRGLWVNGSAVAPWLFRPTRLVGDSKSKRYHSSRCSHVARCRSCAVALGSAAAAARAGYRAHSCVTPRVLANLADTSTKPRVHVQPPSPARRCTAHAQCMLLPPGTPCVCPPCGRVKRRAYRAADARAILRRLRAAKCTGTACPACATIWLGKHARCVRGQCVAQ